jgi:alpha-mannosidase
VLEISYRMTAGSPLIEFIVSGENAATNHRLRIGIATGISGAKVFADSAFGPIERVPIETTAEEAKIERAPATAPLHRYVSLFSPQCGATVHSDGLAEYEADGKGVVWITLLRAVGDLSRNDLRERPGHAGWPADTPDAQSIGPFEARFALHLHEARMPTTIDEIERESDQFLNPLRAVTVRSMLQRPSQFVGPELAGVGMAFSAIKQSDDGNWLVLRCVNLLDREQTGRWTLPRRIQEAKLARLDETPLSGITVIPGQSVIEFAAGPRAVVTILVR